MIHCWLSRQRNGDYMLTALKPEMREVGKTGKQDWYVRYGDPIGYRGMCAASAKLIWGVAIKPLESVRVWSDGGELQRDGDGIESN